MPMLSDRDCVVQCLAGDRNAFAALVERYEKPLLAMCWNMLGNSDEARDVAQDAFVQAYIHLQTYDSARPFIKWLLGIGAKRCLNRLRQRRSFLRFFSHYSGELLVRGGVSVQEPAIRLEPGKMFQKLSKKERVALTLSVFQDFSSADIAAVLQCSEKTVRVHLFNARRKLKQEACHELQMEQ